MESYIVKPKIVKSPTPRDHIASESVRSQQYNDLYDYHTVCYDVYWTADSQYVELICPPLVNFAEEVRIGKFENRIDGDDSELITCVKFPRTNKITVSKELLDDNGDLKFVFMDGSAVSIQPNINFSKITQGRNVLHTIQKNNNLNWISDWVKFYTKTHDVNTVVIYDNNTDAYSRGELEKTITGSFENEQDGQVIIYEWDVPFGPALPPFVSFFCQPSALEHGRHAVYSDANFVINVDIDEYILNAGKSITQSLDSCNPNEYVYVPGYWVENIPLNPIEAEEQDDEPRAWKYGYCDTYKHNSGKYFYRPQNSINLQDTSMSEHHINGMLPVQDEAFRVAHFAPLTVGWQTKRRAQRKESSRLQSTHWVDPLLLDNFAAVFQEYKVLDKNKLFTNLYLNAIEMRSRSYELPIIDYVKGIVVGAHREIQWRNIFIYQKKTLVFELDIVLAGADRVLAFDLNFGNSMKGDYLLSAMIRGDNEGKDILQLADSFGLNVTLQGHRALIMKEKVNADNKNELTAWAEKCSNYIKFIVNMIKK